MFDPNHFSTQPGLISEDQDARPRPEPQLVFGCNSGESVEADSGACLEETEARRKWRAVFSAFRAVLFASRSFCLMRFDPDDDFDREKPSNSKGARVDWELRPVLQEANGKNLRELNSPSLSRRGSLFFTFPAIHSRLNKSLTQE